MSDWIGVDLDGTLAYWYGWVSPTTIGAPIPAMVKFVKKLLAEGKDVRIFTARVAGSGLYSEKNKSWDSKEFAEQQTKLIQDWCEQWIGFGCRSQQLRTSIWLPTTMTELFVWKGIPGN